MLPEEKSALSAHRFDRAKECLAAAKLLSAHEATMSSALNRTYYAVFHAMRAVLALDGIDMKHHSGIISEFRKRYIKTGIFDRELSVIISRQFDNRTGSDYDDFYIIVKKDVYESLSDAGQFLDAVEGYLTGAGVRLSAKSASAAENEEKM